MEAVRGSHSPDGLWWWSGSEWLPAQSPDRRWWFDGEVWRPMEAPTRRFSLATFDWVAAGLWFAWLVAALVWEGIAIPRHGSPSDSFGWGLLGVAIATGLLMTASGIAVALKRRASLLPLVGYLWILGMVAYVVLKLDDPNPGSAQDDATGAGAAILAIPWLVLVAALITVGYGIGLLIRRRRPAAS